MKNALSLTLYGFALVALFLPLIGILNVRVEDPETLAFLARTVLDDYIINSFLLTAGVGIGTFLIGVSTAWLVVRYRFPFSRLFEWVLILPLAFPAYIMAYLYTDFLDVAGPLQTTIRFMSDLNAQDLAFLNIRSLGGAIFVLTLCLYPYVYLFARTGFLAQAESQMDAARMLGVKGWQQFLSVALPGARPFVFAGLALVMMETLADYGAMSYFNVQVFSTGIYNAWAGYGDMGAAARLSLFLLIPILLFFVLERYARGKMRFYALETAPSKTNSLENLSPMRQVMATAYCMVVAVAGFILPVVILMSLLMSGRNFDVWALTMNTLIFSGFVCLLGIPLALFFAFQKNKARSTWLNNILSLSSYGYAMPGIIIGLGMLVIAGWWQGWGGGLLTGSFLFLVFAYIVRFLAIPMQSLESGLEKIGDSVSDAAHMLGRNGLSRFWHVQLPLLAPSIFSAALILSVEVMKELPMTLILRPFDFDTLAVKAYNYAMDERLNEAALPSLIIVIAGLLPVYLLARLIRGKSD